MLPFDIWMKEVRRLSKVKVFDVQETATLHELWLDECDAIVAAVRIYDLRQGGEGIEAVDVDE